PESPAAMEQTAPAEAEQSDRQTFAIAEVQPYEAEAWSLPHYPEFAPLRNVDFANPEDPVSEPWQVVIDREREQLLDRIRRTNEVPGFTLNSESTQLVRAKLPF